jgi:acyl transferase domain-containing protein
MLVSWLPLFHDMGLIGNVLQALYVGVPCILMAPAAFLQQPLRWLQAISHYRATTSGAPNFAYDLCVSKITPEQRASLDLSSWTVAFNGAEPVRADTLDRFTTAFAPCGFRREAFYPCYGMAEATLFVSGGLPSDPPLLYQVDRVALEQNRVIAATDEQARTLVSCGRSWLDQQLVIVDPESRSACPPGQVGEIWVAGPSVAQGYWNRPEQTQETFQAYLADGHAGPFLRTGDLGHLQDGELFITGRLKDLMIIRGRNHHPQDIELTVEQSHPALRAGCGAAFAIEIEGSEQLVVAQEVRRDQLRKLDTEDVIGAIRQAIAEQHELQVHTVLLLKTNSIPRTSSGKIQRHACRAGFLSGGLNILHRWQQGHTDSMLTDLAPEARPLERSRRAIQDWLVARMARLLKIAPEQLNVGEPLAHYGLDSITAVTLSGDLEAWLGRRLSPTLAYDYPSIQALAAYLAQAPKVETVRPTASTEGNGDAIAIIGIGCRFPGASDPDTFWQRLREGFDAITEVPRSRWDIDAFYDARPATPGKMNTRWGGFLEHVDQFDPQFFGISPREAIHMDPQQRLLLEVSWEALEHAGQAPEQLAGSRTGVFMGMSSADYSHLQHTHGVEAHAYSGTGNALSIAANRLSYLLDLRGPSWTVDTACSSSLVAVHQACQSLRQGECDLALSGGVNLVLTPDLTISFSQAQMLAADGRCKTFDAAADGYVRGEGCGVVVLKRLSDARRAGDPILAVIQGSAVNQDGRSNGLTAPNGHAQRAVIRQALARAQVAPAQIGYLEAHGTGTALGDPIEVNALKDVLLEGRSPHSTCWLGSVKTHIGHLEAAAGIAGLIRVALSLQHEEIPPHLHLKRLNPHLALEGTPLAIATERQPWPRSQERRLAGVSAFGFGGTNAHVILEEAPAGVGQAHPVERLQHLLTLSARGEAALAELARRYGDFLTSPPGLALADVCFTANTGRNHFADRLAVVAESPEQLRQELTAFAAGKPSARWLRGQRQGHDRPGIAFLFTGQGSQYRGMGRQLYETQPSFRRTLDQCDEILRPYLAEPLLTVLYSEAEASALLDQTAYTQPALFALEYALAELWRSWGVIPSIVLGHSVGEYVAACVAGAFSLEQGLKLIAERARLMQTLSPPGEMATVFAGEAPVAAALEPYAPQVSLAALNGPENTVISGEPQALQAVLKRLRAAGIETKLLPVSHAFHSPLMEPVLEAFAQVASRTAFQPLRIPLISNLTGQRLAPGHRLEANHWRRHTREPVRFAQGLHTLFEQGYELGLELGPKPVLSSLAKHCQPPPGSTWLASLRQGKEDWQVLLSSLSTLYVQGVEVDWRGFDRDYIRHRLPLPTYPFQRKRYWITPGSLPRDDQPSAAPVTIPSTPSMTARRDSTLATLRSLVARLMQAEPTEVDIQVPFLEMGADSILLMEAIRAIESTFGCKITLRQLFEELTTLDALATYLDQQASAQAPELVQEPPAPTEPSQPATEDGRVEGLRLDEELKHIVTQQLQIMAQQLEVLRSRQGAPVPSSAPAQPQANQQVTSVATRTAQATNTPPVAKEVAREVSGERMAIETRPSAPPPSLPPWGIAEIRARGLNPRQQQHLTALTERYTQHSPTSKRLTQTYRPVLADNRASAGFRFSTKEMLYPLVAERSRGARIWDIDGNEYLDITMGFGVNLCGHNPAFITEALAAQLQQGIALGPQTRLAGEVAQLICELTGMERASFANTGTEAVMTALRLARTATGRPKIALFAGAYHGHFDGTLGTAQAGDTAAVPLAPGVTPNMVADLLVLEYGNPQSLERIKAQAHELAAVLVEPVQSRRPDLQPKAFLKELRALTQDAGIALIFDEMITGFRIHPGGAQAWFGIQADIATYGKIVGGGLPIGVVAGQAAYLDGIDGGLWRYGDASYPQADTTFFAGTFCKHPLTMAAARAMLTHLKVQGPALQTQLNQRTARLAETLNGYFEQEAMPLRIAHFGSLFRFAYASNLDLLFYHLLEKQIYVWEGRNCFLSTAHTEEDIEYLIASVKESMQALRAGGFIPEGRDPPSDSPSAAAAPLSIAVETNLRPAAPAPDPDVNVRESVPLSEAQQQLWVLAKMGEEGSLAYHVSTSLRLQGPLRLTALRPYSRSWTAMRRCGL